MRRTLNFVASTTKRNYLVAELSANLLVKDRKASLLNFKPELFQRTCSIVLGTPSKDYKDYIQAILLDEKKAKAEVEKANRPKTPAKQDKKEAVEKTEEKTEEKPEG